MKTSKYQLKNGLQVLLCESHKAPVISVQMWVRTGSADETKGEEGISHFIEHLVFKGTEKYKVGEIAATIEGAGGDVPRVARRRAAHARAASPTLGGGASSCCDGGGDAHRQLGRDDACDSFFARRRSFAHSALR